MIIQASVALSVDGYIDDTSDKRLVLSHPADWQQVYRLRSLYDAIMVGAETIRRDDPSLTLKDEGRRHWRVVCGKGADPLRVTVSRSGNLDPQSRFFTVGHGEKIVVVGKDTPADRVERLSRVSTVVPLDLPVSAEAMVEVLASRGVRSLFLEGGCQLLTLFLVENRVDLLRVAVAPFFVGDAKAPRLVHPGQFPFDPCHRMDVLAVRQVGDMSVTDYALSRLGRDWFWLRRAVELAACCPVSASAYSVGAVVVTAQGEVFTGYSRETAPDNHAEEEAIRKALRQGVSLEGAVMYSSMEPCSTRKSKPLSCSALIIQHKMSRVVFAAYEPDRFVTCCGASVLKNAGIEVVVLEELAQEALHSNVHILR